MVIIWTLSSSFLYLYGLMLVLLNILTSSYQSWKFYILPPHNKERVLVSVVDSRLSLPGQPWHQPWQYLPCSAASNSRLRRHFAQPDFFQKLSKKPQFIKKKQFGRCFSFHLCPIKQRAKFVTKGTLVRPPVQESWNNVKLKCLQRLEGHVLVGLFFWFPWPRIFCQHCDWSE